MYGAIWHFEPSNSMHFERPNWLDASDTSNLHLALHFCFCCCCWNIPCDATKESTLPISAYCSATKASSHNSAVINQMCFATSHNYCTIIVTRNSVGMWCIRVSFISNSKWKVLNVSASVWNGVCRLNNILTLIYSRSRQFYYATEQFYCNTGDGIKNAQILVWISISSGFSVLIAHFLNFNDDLMTTLNDEFQLLASCVIKASENQFELHMNPRSNASIIWGTNLKTIKTVALNVWISMNKCSFHDANECICRMHKHQNQRHRRFNGC